MRSRFSPVLLALGACCLGAIGCTSTDSGTEVSTAPQSTTSSVTSPTTSGPVVLGTQESPPATVELVLGDVYVSPTGTSQDSGLGPENARSFSAALEDAQPGDNIILLGGIYSEQMEGQAHYVLQADGTPDSWITVRNAPGEVPKIAVTVGTGLEIRGSFIEVNGLEVVGPVEAQAALYGYGIGIRGHHIRVVDNTVHQMGAGGIGAAYSSHLWIEGNTVFENSFWAPEQTSGISTWRQTDGGGDLYEDGYADHIINNVIYRNEVLVPHESGEITDGNGIILDGGANYSGYDLPALIAGNLIVDNGGSAIVVLGTVNVDVLHNTTYLNARTREIAGGGSEIAVSTGSSGVTISNNIFWARDEVPTIKYWQGTGESSNNILVEGNESQSGSSAEDIVVSGTGLLNAPGIAPDLSSFMLAQGSAAIDAGTGGLDQDGVDVAGGLRVQGQRIDIGALEYQEPGSGGGQEETSETPAETESSANDNSTSTTSPALTTSTEGAGDSSSAESSIVEQSGSVSDRSTTSAQPATTESSAGQTSDSSVDQDFESLPPSEVLAFQDQSPTLVQPNSGLSMSWALVALLGVPAALLWRRRT